jgi:hypothetical protein
MNTTQSTKFRPVHLSAFERFNVPTMCGCCGRDGLKKTVKVSNGVTTMFMGTGCAAKACKLSADGFKSAQGKAAAGAHAAFLDMLCPEFAGQWGKQVALVGAWLARYEVYNRTGVVLVQEPEDARKAYATALEALGIGVDGKDSQLAQCHKFTDEQKIATLPYLRASYVAWRGEDDANRRGIGTVAWFQKIVNGI